MRSIRQGVMACAIGASLMGVGIADAKPTFTEDVAPIIYEHCADCHRPNQIGPMSLLTYKDVRPWAKSIRKTVSDKTMPPWSADPAHGDFVGARVLSDEEIKTLVDWADAGSPLGNPLKLKKPPVFEDAEWRMGTPDQVFTMAEDYFVPDDLEDRYEAFLVPSGLTEDKWVKSIELRPGAPEAVHHILVFLVPPGFNFSSDGGEGVIGSIAQTLIQPGTNSGLFGKYAPGGHPVTWPEGAARKVAAGSNFIFQVHYHKNPGPGTSAVDRSSMALKYTDEPVERQITTAWLINPIFELQPGDNRARARSYFMFLDEGSIHGLAPHMHLRGTDFKYTAMYPNGEKEVLLSVPKWDFNWQTNYIFKTPKRIPMGTIIQAEAHWDNSAANPHNPDPTDSVTFGEATTEEMMIGFMDFSYKNAPWLQLQLGIPGEDDIREWGGRQLDEVQYTVRERLSDGIRSLADAVRVDE